MKSNKAIKYSRGAAVLLLLVLACCGIKAQVPFTAVPYKNEARNGNKQFGSGNYGEAEINYRKALEKNDSMSQARFNLGDALYKQAEYDTAGRQKRLDEAINQFQGLTQSGDDKIRAKAYHNIGNAYLGQQKWQDAVNAYINALKLNPSDPDTKYNLAYANAQIMRQKQQQKDQQNKKKDDKKDQKKDQQNKNDDKNKQDKGKDQQAKQGDKKDQQPQPQKAKLTKDEAEKLLQAIANEEKKTNQKVQQKQVKPVYGKPEKDW